MRTFSSLFLFPLISASLLFAGKPTPQPAYSWTVVLVNGGNILGGSDVTEDSLGTLMGCTTSSTDPLCAELSGKSGWVYRPTDALATGQVRDMGALFYPGYPREVNFSMLLSASAGHKHVKFGSLLPAPAANRDAKTTSSRNLTTTRQPAKECFVNFTDLSSDPDFYKCVIQSFLEVENHPQAGYSEVRFSFMGPGRLMDQPAPSGYWPATFMLEDKYSSGDEAGPCNLNKANISAWDYPNAEPLQPSSTLPTQPGTFMRRIGPDSWQAVVQADFSGSNPFRPAVQDDMTASCYEFPNKTTQVIWQNSGRPTVNATFYFIRKLQ